MEHFKCRQCGKCCREFVICITYSDIIRWVNQNRWDILKEVAFARNAPQGEGFYFEHTITAPKKPCIFLNKNNLCSIQDTKPVCCKDAPNGFKDFSLCPAWKMSYININRARKVVARQNKDFKKCVDNFEELLRITFKARGYDCLLKVNM